jgi:hypothetical protein
VHFPPAALEKTLEDKIDALLAGDAADALAWLRGWIDSKTQQLLTGPIVRDALKLAGFPISVLREDKDALAQLEASVKRAVRRSAWAQPTAVDGSALRVHHPGKQQLTDILKNSGGPQIVVVHGPAGSGKSTAVTEALDDLNRDGWFAASITMDGKAVETRSAAALGAANDLSGSPARLLGAMTAFSDADLHAVLVIDQLDAVSQYGGRMPAAFEAVAEVLEQVASFPAVKVVLAIRTVDLREDRRISQLLTNESRIAELEIARLQPEHLRTSLEAAGVDINALSEETFELLRLPLHLAVYMRITPSKRVSSFGSLSALYAGYTEDVRSRLEQERPHLRWQQMMALLIEAISSRQRLRVPVAVLNPVPSGDVRALVSAGVLEVGDGEARLFHETYFDYLFAINFVTKGQSLHSFLIQDGQELFRRAQTRQVLEYLAATEPVVFRSTVVELLTSKRIRSHLKAVVATVLTQHAPTADDWLALEPIAFGADRTAAARVLPLISSTEWFEAADSAGRLQAYLNHPTQADVVMRWLLYLPPECGGRISELLRRYVGTTAAWRQRFQLLAHWSVTPALVDLTIAAISAGDLDGALGDTSGHSSTDLFTNLYGLRTDDPAGAIRVIGATVRRALELTEAQGQTDPFTVDILPEHSPGTDQMIEDLASASPETYLAELLEIVVSVVESTAAPSQSGGLSQSTRWSTQPIGGRDGVPGALYTGLDTALRAVAASNPDAAVKPLTQLALSSVEELRWLACRAYQTMPRHQDGLAFLQADNGNLNLGYINSPRWATRELVAAVASRCSTEEASALGETLMAYELATWARSAPDAAEWRVEAIYELLTAIPAAQRPPAVTKSVADFEATHPGYSILPPQPIAMARPIGSPIAEEDSESLTDDEWIAAIAQYPELLSRGIEGSAYQLASQLGRRAAENPLRFANLALRIDSTAPAVHLLRIITAIATSVEIDVLSQVCVHAFQTAGVEVLRTVNDAIEAAGGADEGLLTLLDQAVAVNAQEEETYKSGEDILTVGLNSVPGTAARAIATLWFASDIHVERLLPGVTALSSAPSVATRAMAAEAVSALLNHNRDRALDLADTLFLDAPPEIFQAPTVGRLLLYCLNRSKERFAPHLARALAGPEKSAQVGGEIWASAAVRDELDASLEVPVDALSPAARVGAARLVATVPMTRLEMVQALLNDEDSKVRREAVQAATALATAETDAAEELLACLLTTEAFADGYIDVIDALADRVQVLPPSTIDACERAATAGGLDIGDISMAPARIAQDLSRVIFRLYQQSESEAMRARCLDVIDQLTDARAYGLSRLLDSQR